MDKDLAGSLPLGTKRPSGQQETVIAYCRACKLAYPVGAGIPIDCIMQRSKKCLPVERSRIAVALYNL